MAVARVVHEEVFVHLEQPREEHLLDEMLQLGHHARLEEQTAETQRHLKSKAGEASPLVVHAGPHRLYVDPDVDLTELDKKFRKEELDIVESDRQTPATKLFRNELGGLVALSIPITGAVVIEIIPQLLITMLVGRVSGRDSPRVLAAGTLADFVATLTYVNLTSGLGAAVSAVCAQAYGAKQYTQLWLNAQAGLVACSYFLVPIIFVCLNGETILRLLGQDPSLAHTASKFISIGLISVPFVMASTVATSALQAQNIALPFIIASGVSYAITLPLAYVIGYHTALGYVGVLLCMAFSSMIKLAAVVPVLIRNQVFIEAWPGWHWVEAHRLARKLWPLMAGSIVMTMCLSLGMSITGLLCGWLPDPADVMSASSITTMLLMLAYIPMIGLSTAGTVRVGNALGAGEPRRASFATTAIFASMLVVSAVGVWICWVIARPYAAANTMDKSVVDLVVRLSTHLLVFIPISGTVIVIQSILQPCGEMWLGAKLNLLFFFVLAVPLRMVLAMHFNGGVFGLWNGQILASLGFIVAGSAWLYRLDWSTMAHHVRLQAHLHVEAEPSSEPRSELV